MVCGLIYHNYQYAPNFPVAVVDPDGGFASNTTTKDELMETIWLEKRFRKPRPNIVKSQFLNIGKIAIIW